MGPFQVAAITHLQNSLNKAMSQLRVLVERSFGDILDYLRFLDFKKSQTATKRRWKNVYSVREC